MQDSQYKNHIQSIEFDAGYEDEVKRIVKRTEPEAELHQKDDAFTRRSNGPSGTGCPGCSSDSIGSSGSSGSSGLRRVLFRIETSIVVSIALFVIGFLIPNLSYVFFGSAYILMGHKVVFSAVRNIFHGKVFDENFLMTIATIGAIAIGEIPEAVGVMLFYTIGEYFQAKAVEKSRRSITALLDLRPSFARRSTAHGPQEVSPEKIKVGEQILVYAGEQIPLDGRVVEGSSYVDTSALTGEAVPKSIEPGDSVLGGYVNGAGTLTVSAEKP
ncbi:MAG: heavy metal translocating P-type ATPase, partial [Spirochaetota bacterium]